MEKVWITGKDDVMNYQTAFRLHVPQTDQPTEITLCTNTVFQLFVNGELIGVGPRRNAKGYSIINRYDISAFTSRGDAVVAVLCVSYRVNSYYIVDEPPFFAGEAVSGDRTIQFSAYDYNPRVQKSERYCMQRCFAESYVLDRDPRDFLNGAYTPAPLPLSAVEGNIMLEAALPYPELRPVYPHTAEWGALTRPEKCFRYEPPLSARISPVNKGYPDDQLTERISIEAGRFGYEPADGPVPRVIENGYLLYDLGANKSGFLSLGARTYGDCLIYLIFDEIIWDEVRDDGLGKYFPGTAKPLAFYRLGTVNVVKFALKGGAEYKLNTIEPYTLRYLKVIVSGRAEIYDVNMIVLENPDARLLKFDCDDGKLSAVMEAARSTFAQNALDVPTDCPSRERAGWLCDSYFTGRSELLFTGKNNIERNFLDAYLRMPADNLIPEEMLPMCYPADHTNGNYIPNWAMWFVIELEDYCKRSGDAAYADKFRNRIDGLVDFFERYRNEEGLLENLDKWVFVEWSKANSMVKGVNFPTNMLYSAMLAAAGRMLGNKRYSDMADELRETIVRESFDGKFFRDQKLRGADGRTVVTEGCSETCQYYAFYFGIAAKERFPELYSVMTERFGPKRDSSKDFPDVYPSNAFIGDFMRLDWLLRDGQTKRVLDESMDYFYKMALRTGTLWEYDRPMASCCHGFASYTAAFILAGVFGYRGFDTASRTPILITPAVPVRASAEIPVPGGTLRLDSADFKTEWKLYRA